MTIGIGGAGSKLAAKLDSQAILVNVSESELNKVPGGKERILATVRSERGQFRGSRKDPQIGHDAYQSVRRDLLGKIRGEKVFSSTGGGTGNGITTGLLEDISEQNDIDKSNKTFFAFVLPYEQLESSEYVDNTIAFLSGPLAKAIDKGNTGNIVLFSNKVKFEQRLSEDEFNNMLIESLKEFLDIPNKNEIHRLLDGHTDYEDFNEWLAKPYFNHFTSFDYEYKPSKYEIDEDLKGEEREKAIEKRNAKAASDFGKQLEEHHNPLLLEPETAIEAMFLLEVPKDGDATLMYNIVSYFSTLNLRAVGSVVENPDLVKPHVTVSILYSGKPAEQLESFKKNSEEIHQERVRKTIDQNVELTPLKVNLEDEAKRVIRQRGVKEDILETLKRIGKL
ncbi:MAG: hypothetical protein IJJ26_07865 [Victivallales bacterium]|nr:hypothetical protein [Victivallales bacterium]